MRPQYKQGILSNIHQAILLVTFHLVWFTKEMHKAGITVLIFEWTGYFWGPPSLTRACRIAYAYNIVSSRKQSANACCTTEWSLRTFLTTTSERARFMCEQHHSNNSARSRQSKPITIHGAVTFGIPFYIYNKWNLKVVYQWRKCRYATFTNNKYSRKNIIYILIE